jgi:hypothetical protein
VFQRVFPFNAADLPVIDFDPSTIAAR